MGTVVATLGKQRRKDGCKFETSHGVCTASSSSARAPGSRDSNLEGTLPALLAGPGCQAGGRGAQGERAGYLVDRGVLPQRQVPEAAADLVPALPDCGQRRGRERRTLGRGPGDGAPRGTRGTGLGGGSSPWTTTDWVIPPRSHSRLHIRAQRRATRGGRKSRHSRKCSHRR